MRSLIVFALLAFLAVAFVAARPAEDEESSSLAVVEIPALNSTNNGEETSEASAVTTGASVEKHIYPFWPRFGGHGPVVIRRHPGFETILPVL